MGAAGIGINAAMRRVDSEEFGPLVEVPMFHWKFVRLQAILPKPVGEKHLSTTTRQAVSRQIWLQR